MISDAYVTVTCDKCKYDQAYELTACAQKSWDERNIKKELTHDGWVIDGDCHYCETCKENEND